MNSFPPRPPGRWLILVLAAVLVLLPPRRQARADSLKSFTGYTRPGAPNDTRADGKVIEIATQEKARKTAIGGTVYFMVLEQGKQGGAVKGDPWGSGIEDLVKQFRRGVDSGGASSPELDVSAKYLYLYQAVNDRGTELPIQSTSVELLVDLKKKEITSWGAFDGLGFALPLDKNKNEGKILPVSATFKDAAATDRIYRSPSPAVPAPREYRLTTVPTQREVRLGKGGIARVEGKVLDPAVPPDYVMLLAGAAGGRPTFRALWNTNSLANGRRGTIFGFTSKLPPTLEPVQIIGPRPPARGVGPAALTDPAPGPEGSPLTADGRVPSPRPASAAVAPSETPSPPPPPPPPPSPSQPTLLPPLIPLLSVPTDPGTSSSTPGGSGGFGNGGGGGSAGGFGGGSGGGGTGGGSAAVVSGQGQQGTLLQQGQQQQQQQQNPTSPTLTALQQINLDVQVAVLQDLQASQNVSVNQSQDQSQSQRQRQRQRQQQQQNQQQTQNGGAGEIVPEPPAIVLGLVGLGFFVWMLWKFMSP